MTIRLDLSGVHGPLRRPDVVAWQDFANLIEAHLRLEHAVTITIDRYGFAEITTGTED